jgi:hypothetical protein
VKGPAGQSLAQPAFNTPPCDLYDPKGIPSGFLVFIAKEVKLARRLLVNRDRLVNAHKTRVANLTVSLFDRIQGHPVKEEQLLALAAGFVLMSEATGVPAQDAFQAVKNLMVDEKHSERRDHRFAAMKHHLETELLR